MATTLPASLNWPAAIDGAPVTVLGFSPSGTPIFNLTDKLKALISQLDQGAHEDAAGHLCDLLEYCRRRITPDRRPPFADLREMVDYYGRHPTPVVEERQEEER